MLSKILSFYRSILVSVFMANVARKTCLFWRAKWCFYPPLRSALCPENVPLQSKNGVAAEVLNRIEALLSSVRSVRL